jgi:hypothetical protein
MLLSAINSPRVVSSCTTSSNDDTTANEYQAVYIAETPRKIEEEPQVVNQETNVPVQSTIERKRSVKKVILLYDDGSFEEFNK